MRSRSQIPQIIVWCLWIGITISQLSAQIPVGTFRAHLSYFGCKSISASPEYIYAACESGLLYVHRGDNQVGTFSKVDGLAETAVTRIYYDKDSRYLAIAYDNGNLDFIRDDKITNVSDIKDKSITSEKKIHGFFSYNGILYLTCPFGIVSIDMQTLLIKDTWYTNIGSSRLETNNLQVYNGRFVLTTEAGIYTTPVNNSSIADFTTWQKINETGDDNYTDCLVLHDRLYVLKEGTESDTLYYKDTTGWHASSITTTPIRAIATDGNRLLVCGWNFADVYDAVENHIHFMQWDATYRWQNAQDALIDGETIWVADQNNGLIYNTINDWIVRSIAGNGPYSNSSYTMDCQGDVLALAPGMITETWGPGWLYPDFSFFSNGSWHNIYQKDNPSLTDVYDLSAVAINPQNTDDFFVGTFNGGLRRYNTSTITAVYDKSNSPIRSEDTLQGRIGGLAFDANNNLWVSCCYSNVPICVLQSNGNWQPLTLSSYTTGYSTEVGKIMVDSKNYKWIILPRSNKLLVYNDNNTISNPNDDKIANINMNAAANIETSSINCVAEDNDGEIWIGCNLGIKVLYNTNGLFQKPLYAQNILVTQIDYVQNLFEFEEVTSIAVDGGNRKWVGTAKSGVFLISEDGTKQLLHFTEENSPLLSNKIYNITINHQTGEVFIATNKGLISYMGTATKGTEDYDDVTVFPNPVRENYHGVITVRGLMEHSFCKIADAAGHLVWQGYAQGGELTWDGHDFYGKRPATGVYFVFSSDETGKEKNVAKILFIK